MSDQQPEVKPDILATAQLIDNITESLSRERWYFNKQAIRAAIAEVLGNSGVWSRLPESVDMAKRAVEQEAEIKRLQKELGQQVNPGKKCACDCHDRSGTDLCCSDCVKYYDGLIPASLDHLSYLDVILRYGICSHRGWQEDAKRFSDELQNRMRASDEEIKRLRQELGQNIRKAELRSSLRVTHTHTFATLEISQPAFDEIKAKLEAAGYQDQFQKDGDTLLIDMHGIAVHGDGKKPLPRRTDEAPDREWPGRDPEEGAFPSLIKFVAGGGNEEDYRQIYPSDLLATEGLDADGEKHSVDNDRVLVDGNWIPVERAVVVKVEIPRDEHFYRASGDARLAIIYEMLKEKE